MSEEKMQHQKKYIYITFIMTALSGFLLCYSIFQPFPINLIIIPSILSLICAFIAINTTAKIYFLQGQLYELKILRQELENLKMKKAET